MKMKIIIYITEDGDIFFYQPSEDGETVLIEPRIKKKEGESKEDEETFH